MTGSAAAVVEVRDGRFGYQGETVVRADLSIGPGEVVALLGPNGSGKTTLLKGILGLVDRLGGTVELFGQPLRDFRERALIGYVPQRHSAAGPIPVTVRELVRSGRVRTAFGGRDREGRDAAVAAAIAAVGLSDRERDLVSALSGGQQRRALVARALAGGAKVLFLDEPLAGVDQANQVALATALRARVEAEPDTTIVVVLHELGPLEPFVTRAVCLDGGRLNFDGPLATAPPELLHLGHDHDPHGDGHHSGHVRPTRLGLIR